MENEIVPAPDEQITPMTLMARGIEAKMSPEQLGKFMDLQERWERNLAAKQFSETLARFQGVCPQIKKNRGVSLTGKATPDYMFASYCDIMAVIQPLLASCKLSVSFSSEQTTNGAITVVCTVRCGTHAEKSTMTIPIPAAMRVNDSQKMGAAMSYAKRYALCSALNIVVTDEDRDAQFPDDVITRDQVKIIADLIAASGTDVARFLTWAGADQLADLPTRQYQIAKAMLEKKLDAGEAK